MAKGTRRTKASAEGGRSGQAPAASPTTAVPGMKLPKSLAPASVRFAAPQTVVIMTAARVSKPTQSLIAARTGLRLGPGQPIRVRVAR